MKANGKKVYAKIAANLRDFGYDQTTEAMVEEVHEAMLKRKVVVPHGIIGRFARDQLEAQEAVRRGR